MEELKNLMDALAVAKDEARALMNDAKATPDEIKAKTEEIKTIKAKIEAQEALESEEGEELRQMATEPIYAEVKDNKGPFKSFGEQMQAIVRSSRPGVAVDEKLIAVQNASGANESVPAEGGFLVQKDFASEIIKVVFDTGILAPKCQQVKIGANSNGTKLNGVDETNRADGYRWGGVQGYWANEAATVTASKPKFRQIELNLNKVMALYYATEELLADSDQMDSILTKAFGDEIKFKVDDAIFRGDGAGKPLGILNAGCLVSQTAETGQAAATILAENLSKMWTRMPFSMRNNAVWLINQEIEPQLESLAFAIGTAGIPSPMAVEYMTKGTLRGRPVISIEHAAALGTVGDIVLADMSQYLLASKGNMNFASSMHVQFKYDEMTFRVTYRVDGQPAFAKAITPFKGSATLSPFVALATRS